ncbi:MAG: hypothetical protein QOF62_875 [Pyrinomonadaceae bacterium]|jgi:hypothetical protein|nr:hypothetical protein [Pyrinomonadaceae bacterium]
MAKEGIEEERKYEIRKYTFSTGVGTTVGEVYHTKQSLSVTAAGQERRDEV